LIISYEQLLCDDVLYLHAAKLGKKLDIINENPQVCFGIDYKAELFPAPTAGA